VDTASGRRLVAGRPPSVTWDQVVAGDGDPVRSLGRCAAWYGPAPA